MNLLLKLFWYTNFNAYGYTSNIRSVMLDNDKESFLEKILETLENSLKHELVCRIPIPINNSSAGFLGKVNKDSI